jgi:hypothetical protein
MPLINYPVSRQSLSYPLLPRHQNILPAHLQIPTHNCSTLRLVPISQLPEHQHGWQQGEVPREIYQRIRRFPQTNFILAAESELIGFHAFQLYIVRLLQPRRRIH